MLSKKCILTTFCSTLCLLGFVQAKYAWESVSFQKIINTDHYLLKNNQQIRLADINGIDLNQPTQDSSCLTESTKLRLNHLLLSNPLKSQKLPGQVRRPHIKTVYLKSGTTDVVIYLLKNGLATAKSTATKAYKEAQSLAQKEHKGIWGSCDPHLSLKKWVKQNGRMPWFWDRYHSYLETGAVGRVQKVLTGDLLELDNGLRVKLAGLVVPDTESDKPGHQCFAKHSQAHLARLALGQTVYLASSPTPVSGHRQVSRQVYLPKTAWRPEIWLNQVMIQEGFARWDNTFESPDLETTELKALENPAGAWQQCASKIQESLMPTTETKITPKVDPDCPIKGNIAGSKKNPKKTYHTPASGWYQRIKAEVCFSTEIEAEMAGFMKVK